MADALRTEVSSLQLSDHPAAVKVLVDAFWSYPETLHLLKAERTRRFGLTCFMRSTLDDALPSGEVLVARDRESIVGVAVWKPPSKAVRSGVARLRQAVELLPVGLLVPGAIREAVACSNVMRRRRPAASHYYLAAIGVHPEWQGQGVGRCLLQPIFARADEQGTGCYLSTATRENVVWYSSQGFEVTAKFHPTPRWPTVWTMWRAPRANSAQEPTAPRRVAAAQRQGRWADR